MEKGQAKERNKKGKRTTKGRPTDRCRIVVHYCPALAGAPGWDNKKLTFFEVFDFVAGGGPGFGLPPAWRWPSGNPYEVLIRTPGLMVAGALLLLLLPHPPLLPTAPRVTTRIATTLVRLLAVTAQQQKAM